MVKEPLMRTVFLSASVPLAHRDDRYYETCDVISIRDSVKALISVLGADGRIVCGGHPAITPMIHMQMKAMGLDAHEAISLYRSEYFRTIFPDDNEFFLNVTYTKKFETEAESLAQMRQDMLTRHHFDAAIFVGGMEGVEAEYELWGKLHPKVPAFPIGSTGAAAALILDRADAAGLRFFSMGTPIDVGSALREELRYLTLFRALLDL
jgi:hypothetical protein